ISSDGTQDGIAWAVRADQFNTDGPAVLYAFDANDLSTILYESDTNESRDSAGPANKFSVPVVTNGKVYVATNGQVDVYGLLSGESGQCSAPSSNGINVCSPAENATVTSPVSIDAAATVSGGVYRFELWNGGTKLASVSNSGVMNQSLPLAPGTYTLTFAAYNTTGTEVYATRNITV